MEDRQGADKGIWFLFQEPVQVVHCLLVELDCCSSALLALLGLAAVASCADDRDLEDGDLAHDWPLLAPDLPEGGGRPLVEPIHLIHSLQASVLDHLLGP